MSKVRKHGSHFCNLPSLWQGVPKMWEGWSSGKCVSIFWNPSAQGQGRWPEGQGDTEGEEFLEVMSMDQRAGVWPVEESGS